ncbi:hypothetical protein HCU64_23360 [Methylobacterium sp. C25]|uniref:hypothetical protein n=1 Tax=Methylobacterium sp. C25 TaxID=2721622 RepID=UPI001F28FD01|nr:hypothetical protein [Methylobacterium sp. C25]MCE4226685.1 hypothetical protein [Methylobacterium sp. C25]
MNAARWKQARWTPFDPVTARFLISERSFVGLAVGSADPLQFAAASAILICTGATAEEVCAIGLDDLRQANGIRTIRFPDRRGIVLQDVTREIPLLAPACDALDAHLARFTGPREASCNLWSGIPGTGPAADDLAQAMFQALRANRDLPVDIRKTRDLMAAAARTFQSALYSARVEDDLLAYLTSRGSANRMSSRDRQRRHRDPANILRILNRHHVLGARYASGSARQGDAAAPRR